MIWCFTSHNLTMFTVAENYNDAKADFKPMLLKYLTRNPDAALDEIIEIIALKDDGKYDETSSHIEFADEWLKELKIKYVFR
ncbi:MAG: hypothetical protein QMC80_02195 [Thermoplasmatales archaeon]|nr:hypothetical protein [Thermoplasmatales archaeon]